MWQIRLDELDNEAFLPNGKLNWHNGIFTWFCPLCGQVVGMESDGSVHEKEVFFRKDACPNGHSVDWEAMNEQQRQG